MVPTPQSPDTSESNPKMTTTNEPESARQISNNADQNTMEDASSCSKRRCSITDRMVACPIAEFGCTSSLHEDELAEHFASKFHHKNLLEAIEKYVRQLHDRPDTDQSWSDIDESSNFHTNESIRMLTEAISCLRDDNIELHETFLRFVSDGMEQEKQMELLNKSTVHVSQAMNAIQMNHNVLQTEMETFKETLRETSSPASNDGSYIWKITNIQDKFENAISERQASIYSPPFYSSPTGYKMCMRLYLDGDGQARRTHLSLFFVLMRGDYDAILTWPFSYKVSFVLYDQSGCGAHIVDSFRPDIKSNSFMKPRSNMNIASGIPKFMPLPTIRQANSPYVRDDCMFIRCIVDFASMPKTFIPYITRMNPGLPLSIQQTLIQNEIQKQSTSTPAEQNTDVDGTA